jgi:hypothetical protein
MTGEETTFPALVTISGGATSGDLVIAIKQTDVPPEPIPPEPNPGPEPEPGDWEPPSWLRTDMERLTVPSVPVPAYQKTIVDQIFHSRVTRVSGNPGDSIKNIPGMTWPDACGHHYNSDQAWNADGSLIYLDNPGVFIDGKAPFDPRFKATGLPSDADVRWHVSDPNLMVFAAGSKVGTWNPKTGEQKVIVDLGSKYASCKLGPWEGALSEDGQWIAVSCTYEGQFTGFAYNIVTGEKGKNLWASEVNTGKCDAIKISSKGSYIIWTFDPETSVVTDRLGAIVTRLANNWISHFDVCTDGNGEEVAVGRDNNNGRLAKTRLRDGQRTYLTGGGWCSHTSARQQTRHRWAVTAPTDEAGRYDYGGEVIMAELDGSKVYRLCHTHTPSHVDYKAEVQPSHSRDGTQVIFRSAWGGSGDTPRPVGCYVVEFAQ